MERQSFGAMSILIFSLIWLHHIVGEPLKMETLSFGAMSLLTFLLMWLACGIASSPCPDVGAPSLVGLNYGRVADDLPSPTEVANLVHRLNINHIKIFDYDASVIQAFDNTNISLTICVPNQEILNLADSADAALTWVQVNVQTRVPAANITAIAVGNEISGDLWHALVPAMWKLHAALEQFDLEDGIKISSPVSMGVLAASYPPSAGAFGDIAVMEPLLAFLKQTGSSFMINIYPYFVFRDDPVNVAPEYALFGGNNGVHDANTSLQYSNLFDAMYDATVFAMKNLGYDDIPLVVTETGWPSKGEEAEADAATMENAESYNNNLIKHLRSNKGSPARPGEPIQVFIFALFNENQKPGMLSERNFGLLYPNMTTVYDFQF